jgi:hypothetical protein
MQIDRNNSHYAMGAALVKIELKASANASRDLVG